MSRSLSQKLTLYGLGVGAASLASSANADIVAYTGPAVTGNSIFFDLQNLVAPSTTNDPVNDDFGLGKFKNKASSYDINGNTTTAGYTDGVVRGTNNDNYAIRHSAGDTIGSGGNFLTFTYLQNTYTGSPPGQNLGDWHPGDRGFLGLRLVIGTDTFFGWADVTLNNLDGTGAGALTLNGYAYAFRNG